MIQYVDVDGEMFVFVLILVLPGVPPGEFYVFSKNTFYSDQMSLLHKSPFDQNHFLILQQEGEDMDPNRGQRDIEYCRGLKEEGKFRIIIVALYEKPSKMISK